jgi:hypothetical protein
MSLAPEFDPARPWLRHCLATLAYRGAKAVRNAPPEFANFQAAEGLRTPGQILAHIGDLMDWGLAMARGKREWHESKPLAWEKEVERFFATLSSFDDLLASTEPVQAPVDKLLQGPVADALTHLGQLAMLRRIAGAPLKAENFYKAEVVVGRLGADQARPKLEF